jgi:hypothetical protein
LVRHMAPSKDVGTILPAQIQCQGAKNPALLVKENFGGHAK